MRQKDFPVDIDMKPGEISASTKLAMELAELPTIDTSDPEQIAQRLSWYFDFCQRSDTRPLVTGLCLVLNTTRPSLIAWEKEQSERGKLIRKAKGTIRYLLELWSTSGKLSPPIAIFWAKNLLDMSDNVTITAQSADNTPRASLTPQEIAARIAEDVPVDEQDGEPLQIESGII